MKTEELDAINEVELSDDELKEIAGGLGNGVITCMRCDVCGIELEWAGNYMDGNMYMCPQTEGIWGGGPICTATKPSFHGYKHKK